MLTLMTRSSGEAAALLGEDAHALLLPLRLALARDLPPPVCSDLVDDDYDDDGSEGEEVPLAARAAAKAAAQQGTLDTFVKRTAPKAAGASAKPTPAAKAKKPGAAAQGGGRGGAGDGKKRSATVAGARVG